MNILKIIIVIASVITVLCSSTPQTQTKNDNDMKSVIVYFLTSSSCHPKIFIKEFCNFLVPCHQHCLRVNVLVQR